MSKPMNLKRPTGGYTMNDNTYKTCAVCGESFREFAIALKRHDQYRCEMPNVYLCGPQCLHTYVITEKQEELGW